MGKTSISVPEMQRLLGMKKVEAYSVSYTHLDVYKRQLLFHVQLF